MAGVSSLTASADIALGPGPRPWTEHWEILKHAHADLATFFATLDATVEQWKVHRVINEFAVVCYHLKDHLKGDLSIPQNARSGVEKHVSASQALALVGDIANTVKHRQRNPGQRYARVGEIRTGPHAVVHWEAADGSTGQRDVLGLADDAMRDWGSYLQGANLLP